MGEGLEFRLRTAHAGLSSLLIAFLDASAHRAERQCRSASRTSCWPSSSSAAAAWASTRLCKQSGKIYWHSELLDDVEDTPTTSRTTTNTWTIPDKRTLDLGKPLALDFAREFLPNDFDMVRQIFSRRGAYAKFKDLLEHRRMLDRWYDFRGESRGSRVAGVVQAQCDRARRLTSASRPRRCSRCHVRQTIVAKRKLRGLFPGTCSSLSASLLRMGRLSCPSCTPAAKGSAASPRRETARHCSPVCPELAEDGTGACPIAFPIVGRI